MTSEFQQASSEQGKAFEEAVAVVLKCSGWRIVETHAKVEGLEVDIVAEAPNGVEWWIECKGSWRGRSQGSKRGDTVKKAVGVAWFFGTLPDCKPYMLVTSHMPTDGTVSHTLLTQAREDGLFDDIKVIGFTVDSDIEEVDD